MKTRGGVLGCPCSSPWSWGQSLFYVFTPEVTWQHCKNLGLLYKHRKACLSQEELMWQGSRSDPCAGEGEDGRGRCQLHRWGWRAGHRVEELVVAPWDRW